MSTTRITKRTSAAAFVLATTMGLSTAAVLPAQSAVVAAAPAATTTTVTVRDTTLAFGETTNVTVTVDTTTPGGAKPTGKVEFRIGDKVLTADVPASGKVDFDLPVVGASTTPYTVTATFIPTDATAFSTSTSAPVAVTVAKDETTSTVTARHNKLKRKIVAKNTITSANGQVPSGKARFVLRRNGIKIAATVVSLNDQGVAKAKFRKVRNKGVYKVVSKYRGNANFLASKGRFTIPR